MRIFDCHAHLACLTPADGIDTVIERMHYASVNECMVICDPGDPEPDHERALDIVKRTPGFYISAACHPQNAFHYSEETEQTIRKIAALPVCKCIGEIGLDHYQNESSPEQQQSVFQRQLDIALEYDLPVQLHIRNAHNEALDILRQRKKTGALPRGFVHCFTRSPELADAYLRLGYSISIAGPVTFSNANRLRKTVRMIPADRLLIETDSPWVSPESHRGQPCEPSYIVETLECMAEIRGMDPEQLSACLWDNAAAMFDI